jgi:hypothetical protein
MEYLALEGGPPRFPPDFSCPAVLRCQLGNFNISGTGLSPSMMRLSRRFPYKSITRSPVLQPRSSEEESVWAGPLSLAATKGVSVDFLSSGYLDVSVPRVVLYLPINSAGD